MIISVNAEKVFDKIQHLFMIKLLESGCREKLPQHNKGHIWKTHNSITYPWLLYMILYFLKYLPLGHILYSLRTFYLFTVVFYTSNLIITGSYFRLLEDPSPIQDSFNPYDLHLDSTSAIHVYSGIINWKFYNFELVSNFLTSSFYFPTFSTPNFWQLFKVS